MLDARPVVFDADHCDTPFGRGGDLKHTSFPHGVARIGDQVAQNLSQLAAICEERDRGDVHSDLDAGVDGSNLEDLGNEGA
jgi:hypothetical protein